jgi:hypothetical protein
MQKRACHWRGACLLDFSGYQPTTVLITSAQFFPHPVLNGNSSQWFTSVSVRTGNTVPVAGKKTRTRGGRKRSGPPSRCHEEVRLIDCRDGDQKYNPRDRHAPRQWPPFSLLPFFSAG